MTGTEGSFDPLFRWLESTAFNDWTRGAGGLGAVIAKALAMGGNKERYYAKAEAPAHGTD